MNDERTDGGFCRGRFARWLPRALGAGLLICAFPAVANAKDYCVDVTPACGQTNVADFQDALNQAAAADDADRIFLGPGPHTAPAGSGFAYNKASAPVEIVGSGQGGPDATLLTAQPGASGYVLLLMGGPDTSIHDLRIALPPNVATSFTGLRTNGTARHLTVGEVLPQPNIMRVGVNLSGGLLDQSLVTLGLTGSTGVMLDHVGGTVRASGVSGFRGIVGANGGLIEGTGIVASSDGVAAYRKQTIIRSSTMDIQGSQGVGITALANPGGPDVEVIADGVNIIGANLPFGFGVSAANWAATDVNASVTLRNSILRGFGTTLDAASYGSGSVHVSASYSDYESGKTKSNGLYAKVDEANISNVGDSYFEDPLDLDYRLLPGSPLIDAGDPSTPQGLDAARKPLVTDGNRDGTARRDIGAYELDGPLPVDPPSGGGGSSGGGAGALPPAADRQAPVLSRFSVSIARRRSFRYTLSEPARVTITVHRAVRSGGRVRYRPVGRLSRAGRQGANRIRFARMIGGRVLRMGRYRAVATATDAAANRSTPRRAVFRLARR